jgi:hypothetical protein
MARQVDYEALIAKLQVTDVFMEIREDEPVLIAACMDCDATILRAAGAEVNAASLHLAIVEHACDTPADTVIVDEQGEINQYIADGIIDVNGPPAPETPATPAPIPPRILSLADRCDRCIAQAWVRVKTPAGEVDLCAHHFAAVEMTIAAAGYVVVDERAFINAKPGASATAE